MVNYRSSRKCISNYCPFQSCIKNAVWVPAWHEQLGHVKLIRTTASDREERKKLDKREKKERDEEEERYRTAYNFVKYSLGLRHQVNFKDKKIY